MKTELPKESTPDVKEENLLYAVMKLSKKVNLDSFLGRETVDIDGIAGFIPVFYTLSEAVENACNGKYAVIAIEIPNHE